MSEGETGYHRRERERSEKNAERGQLLEPLRPRWSSEPAAGLDFLALPVALAEWIAGILRRRRDRESGEP